MSCGCNYPNYNYANYPTNGYYNPYNYSNQYSYYNPYNYGCNCGYNDNSWLWILLIIFGFGCGLCFF